LTVAANDVISHVKMPVPASVARRSPGRKIEIHERSRPCQSISASVRRTGSPSHRSWPRTTRSRFTWSHVTGFRALGSQTTI